MSIHLYYCKIRDIRIPTKICSYQYFCNFRDEKQIDFADQLESVAYCLCGDDPITVEHFIQIFNTKGVSIA